MTICRKTCVLKPKSSPTDLVTRLDKEVQELLVSEILSRYPEDKICAEEGCLRASVKEGKVWVIDPSMGPIILWPSRKILLS